MLASETEQELKVHYPQDWQDKYELPEDGYINEDTFELTKAASNDCSLFLLSFTRRSYPLSSLIQTFEHAGLHFEGTVENSCYDLFGNCTDGLTEIWRDCVLAFSTLRPPR
jgi:hypothetical protein